MASNPHQNEASSNIPSATSSPQTKPPKPLPSSLETNVYERTGYDPSAKWQNLLNIFRGRLSEHGQYLYVEDLFHKEEAERVAKCEKDKDYLLAYSPIIRFLSGKVADLGGENITQKIKCERCVTRVVEFDEDEVKAAGGNLKDEYGQQRKKYLRRGGGFSPDHGILICANEVRDRGHLEDVLAHEMVHAWDHLRWKVDWNDLRHSACTEIRASMLSGECRWTREFFKRSHWSVTQQFQNCVRTRATQSVAARPFCKDDVMAAKVVNEVFESCFNDTRPFDEVYR